MTTESFPVPRARVFISCGQSRGTDEVTIASDVASRLADLGFDPYVAVQEQTLRGLKENLFAQLERSEYFLFIDFARERLAGTPEQAFAELPRRGSLFSHQELSVAAYLDLDVIALREIGIKTEDGILGFLQANPIMFEDRSAVADQVIQLVRERWRPGWRKELVLEKEAGHFIDANIGGSRRGRYFHIRVRNLDHKRAALNCRVFLEKLFHLDHDVSIPVETLEFKWAGSPLASGTIGAGAVRSFDAIWFVHGDTTVPKFNVHTDSTQFMPKLNGYGNYVLTFLVVSDNCPPARGSFRLSYRRSVDAIRLEQEPVSSPA